MSFDYCFQEAPLEARPALLHSECEPVMGENYEIALLCRDRVVSAPHTLPPLEGDIWEDVRSFVCAPDADFMAVLLPEGYRVMLIAPLPGTVEGEAVAMLPDIGGGSVLRVLRHAFGDQVRLAKSCRLLSQENVREADAFTYQYLVQLLSRCRAMMGGGVVRQTVAVADRKQLSHQLILTFRKIETFFGIELGGAHVREFPVPFDYNGVFRPTRALWMLLCMTLGLWHSCTARVRDSLRFVPDEELLLPMLEITAGNKTRLPAEWEECCRMAEREGMFFDIRRKRNAIHVRFCPMTPHISPAEFYSLRTLPVLAGLPWESI
jgi:hypothetical protein